MAINTVTQGTTTPSPPSSAGRPGPGVGVKQAGGGQGLPSAGQSVPNSKGAGDGQKGDLEQAISKITQHVQNVQRDLQFSVDKGSGQTVVKIIDSSTDEVIRQIPSQEVLALARNLADISGVLFKTEA